MFDDDSTDPPVDPIDDDAPSERERPPDGEGGMTDELEREMDHLRDQLEAAFAEVVGKVDRLAVRVAAVEQAATTTVASVDQLADRSERTVALVEELVATLDAAVAASAEPWEPDPVAVDLAPISERLGHLDEAVAATHRELVRMQDVPLAVDTSRLEDVASRGSLHNAADIANLRRDVEVLTESARSQDKTLRDLRATLEWIKDRMLR